MSAGEVIQIPEGDYRRGGVPYLDVGDPLRLRDQLVTELGTGPTAGVFRRADGLVVCPRVDEDGYRPLTDHDDPRHRDDDDGPAQVRPLTGEGLAARLDGAYTPFRWVTEGSGNDAEEVRKPTLTPLTVPRRLVAAPDLLTGIRDLHGVVHSPVLRPDWTVLDEPGFDESTGLLLLPLAGAGGKPVRRDGKHVARLLDLLADFPWRTLSDRANYLAAMIGVLLLPALPSMTPPLVLLTAPVKGSGKTLLGRILLALFGGAFRTELPSSDEELTKAAMGLLGTTTAPVILWDNVSGVVRSSTLSSLTTTRRYSGRPLGRSDSVTLRNDRLWVLSGNNIAIGGDMARRALWVTIDADVEKPWLRPTDGFRHPDLMGHVVEHRDQLVADLLALVVEWVQAGRPGVDSSGRSDTFGPFVTHTAAILRHAGVPGEVMGADTDRGDDGGEDDSEWADFLTGLHATFGGRAFRVIDVRAMATSSSGQALRESMPEEIGRRLDKGDGGTWKSLGRLLGRMDGVWAGERCLRVAGRDGTTKRATYRVVERSGA